MQLTQQFTNSPELPPTAVLGTPAQDVKIVRNTLITDLREKHAITDYLAAVALDFMLEDLGIYRLPSQQKDTVERTLAYLDYLRNDTVQSNKAICANATAKIRDSKLAIVFQAITQRFENNSYKLLDDMTCYLKNKYAPLLNPLVLAGTPA